jgi:hypothetical protein
MSQQIQRSVEEVHITLEEVHNHLALALGKLQRLHSHLPNIKNDIHTKIIALTDLIDTSHTATGSLVQDQSLWGRYTENN